MYFLVVVFHGCYLVDSLNYGCSRLPFSAAVCYLALSAIVALIGSPQQDLVSTTKSYAAALELRHSNRRPPFFVNVSVCYLQKALSRLDVFVDIEIVSNLWDEDLMQSSIVILLFAVVVFATQPVIKRARFFDSCVDLNLNGDNCNATVR